MHNLELHFSAGLVLIKASLSYELFTIGQAQTCHLGNTFIHINPTDEKPLLEYSEGTLLTSCKPQHSVVNGNDKLVNVCLFYVVL